MFIRALLLSFLAFFIQTNTLHADDDTLNAVAFYKHSSLDPIYGVSDGDMYILANISERLNRVNEEGELVPILAKHWEVSEDGKTYTFYLKDNLQWSDGAPLVAQDFVTTIHRTLDKNLDEYVKASYMTNFIENSQEIQNDLLPLEKLGIEAIDDKTLQFRLALPISFFPHMLAHPFWSPSPTHVIKQYGESWTDIDKIVVSGAFSPLKAPTKYMFKLKKNMYYYNADNVYFDKVNIHYRENSNDTFVDLLTNKIDLAQRYSGNPEIAIQSRSNSSNSSIKILSEHENATTYTAFNLNYQPLQDVRVRQALSMAIDREKIARRLGVSPTWSFAAPSSNRGWEGVSPVWKDNSHRENIKKAKEFMRAAGYTPFKRLKLEYKVNNTERARKAALLIKEQWNKVWVDCRILIQPSKKHYQDLNGGDYQVARAGWGADYNDPLSFLAILHPDSHLNIPHWKNEQYKSILDELLTKNLSIEDRFERYESLEHIILNDIPLAPVFTPSEYIIISKDLKGIDKLTSTEIPIFSLLRREK